MSITPPNIQLATGACVLQGEDELDFTLDGAFALQWQRTYLSNNDDCGLLGPGWTLPLSFALERSDSHLFFIDLQGRRTQFPLLDVGERFFSRFEHTTLLRSAEQQYELITPEGLRLLFSPLASPGYTNTTDALRLPLQGLRDPNGNGWHLQYDARGLPLELEGTDGYRVAFVYDDGFDSPRLREVRYLADTGAANNFFSRSSRLLVEYRYNSTGDLTAVLDAEGRYCRRFDYANHTLSAHWQPSGQVVRFGWSAHHPDGQVLSVQTSSERQWWLHYDTAERSTRITEQSEGLSRFSIQYFDAEQRLIALHDALGNITRSERDAFGHVIAHIDPQGATTRYSYDEHGNVLVITWPDGTIDALQWDANLRKPVAHTNPLGHTTRYDYDARGNLMRVTAADGSQTTYERDARGLPVAIIDAHDKRRILRLDAIGRVVEYTDCSGQRTHYEWDIYGNLVAFTDALGQRTRYTYRFINRQACLVKLDLPGGSCERFAYDAQSNLIAHHDAMGRTTRYQFDSEGRPLARTDAIGHRLDYRYDGFGRLITLRNENNSYYHFAWDNLDRLIAEQGFDGRRIDYRYDAAGHLLESVDGVPVGGPMLGHGCTSVLRSYYQRDALGRLLEKRAARPGAPALRTRYAYDDAGQLTLARNAFARVQLTYTPNGQIACEQTLSRFGTHTQLRHEYDALGNRITTTLPDGRQLNTLTYGSGHVHQINLDFQVICDFERDSLHRETGRTQGALRSRYEFDALGRLLASHTERPDAGLRPANEQATGQQPKATSAGQRIARRYRYDTTGQLLTLDDARAGQTQYRYDAIGRLLAAGTPTQQEHFAFDPAHNLIESGADTQESADTPAAIHWSDEGWIEYLRTQRPSSNHPPLTAQDMLLDPRQWPAGKGNRLAVWQEHRYAYDHWGNCTDKRSGPHRHLHMQWDAAHQLSAVRIDDARTQESQYWAYAYDPFGRRIAKWHTNEAGQRPAPEAITHFSWDGNRLLTEQQLCRTPDQSEPQLHHKLYVYEPDSFVPLAQVQTVRAPDDPDTILPDPEEASLQQQYPDIWAANVLPLQRRIAARLKNTLPKAPEPPASTTQILYYHTDHLGTPRELTNAEGHIVWEARYKAWGRVHQIDYPAVPHTIADGNTQRQVWIEIPPDERPVQNLRFQGQYHDEETGLHYNRFRYYDPDCGRFASQDPIGLAGGVNTYQYAPNPISWIDPLGLCCDGVVTKGAGKSPNINPGDVANRTPEQIDALARERGLIPRGPDPQAGRGAYVDPATGNQRVLCHTNCANPHAHVNNPQGQRLDIDGNVVLPESPAAHLPINYP
ncbi:RHS repeat-associated core domain-containing protein [Halopseudomonas salegens]|uniref:RHS repeat-associated core domain-containing protein n=1 Tax=Halopseudomonas salegens TaxID=1434072 RepID=A0A1H2E1V8_9GAMM|nr:RHS repeat-associated core domain-containing protein [Halopseudomonas salegens]SDT88688.1 RHS repeat-associated core domain-containing protein [Halopseudomonas salegens]